MSRQLGDFLNELSEFTRRSDPQTVVDMTIAMAEGVLGERYQIPVGLAAELLARRADCSSSKSMSRTAIPT